MRWIIYGAGAVGGAIGARLFQAGESVVLIARGAHLDAIRKDGLRFMTPEEDVRLPVAAVGHPAELRFERDHVVLLCMKSQHTAAALDALVAAAGEEVPVVCAQNGVANERIAARRFARTYAMVVMLPANHLEPGVVQAQSRATTGVLDVGLYPGGTDERCAELAAGLERSRLSCRPDPAVMRLKYAKLLDNLSNALAVCSAPREAGDLARAARQEAIRCYRAAGIEWTSEEDFSARRGTLIQPGPIAGQGRSGGSSWQSLARGTGNIEADYLNGEIFLLGRLHGVPTPVNRALQLAANQLAREGKPPGTLAVAELRARVEALSRA